MVEEPVGKVVRRVIIEKEQHKMCLVSVIMAVYNDESRVGRAIESVKRQTFQDWELLCIDDGSTDNTSIILDTKASLDDRIISHRIAGREKLGILA